MESGAVSFVSAWHKNPHHVCSTYASELWSRIQVVKPNAKLYTRQYSSFSQTLQFSLLPRLANSAQLWCLQINFIYLNIKKIMAFVLYFKRKTETMETVRKKKTKQIILSLNSEHYRSSWESTQVISWEQNFYKEQSTCIYPTLCVRKPYNSSKCPEAIP